MDDTNSASATVGHADNSLFVTNPGGSGPPALLLHGFGSDRLSWLANQSEIAKVANVFALDLPGHGTSGNDVGDGRIGTLTERVASVLDKLRLERVDMIGHSLGGAVAIRLAYQRPALVNSLTLIAPAGLGRAIDTTFLAAFPQLSEAGEAEALLRHLVSRPRLINRHMTARVLDHLTRPGVRDALVRVAAGLSDAETYLAPAISVITRSVLPRLVIWGDMDAINPIDRSKLSAFGGTYQVIAGSGHMPQVEAAGIVNAAITAFLKSVHSEERRSG